MDFITLLGVSSPKNLKNTLNKVIETVTGYDNTIAQIQDDIDALEDAALGFEEISNKVTSIDENSTDTEYPSAKLLYDKLALKQDLISSSNKLSTDYIDGLGTAAALDTGTSEGNIPVLDSNGKLSSSVIPESSGVSSVNGRTGAVTGLEEASNKVTSVNSESTDTQYPSAKLLYDQLLLKANKNAVVSTEANQGLTDTQKENARTNIGAGTSSFSGSYNDLSNKPTIPDSDSDLLNDSYVRFDANNQGLTDTQKSNARTNIGAGTSNFSGSYNDLTNKPTIPTVNDATLTIQKNGTTLDTFTANASSNKTINITVPTSASDVSALPSSTKYAASITLEIDPDTYIVTATLKDQDGNTLGTAQTIDLPLESVVISGYYDATNKKIILTLQNGSTIKIPVSDLISGLQTEITSQNKLSSDLVDDANNTNKFVSSSEKSDIASNTSARHTHGNKALLDTYEQTESDLSDAVSKKHSHSNKALLDTYEQTETDLADAVSKKHTHSNKSLLDTYEQTETNLADAVSKKHSHSNKSLLDTYDQTNADIKSAIDNVHTHSNKTLLDSYTQTEVDLADAVSSKHSHSNKSLLDTYTQTEVNLADAVSKKHSHSNLSDLANVLLFTAQTLSDAQKSQARTNIGAGTSNFSGSYNDLSNKPTIPTDTNQKIKTSSVTFGADDVVEIEAGSNVSVIGDATNKKITISATDTTYESKTAASGGTDVSLVTTGEKYNWNNKQDVEKWSISSADNSKYTKFLELTPASSGKPSFYGIIAINSTRNSYDGRGTTISITAKYDDATTLHNVEIRYLDKRTDRTDNDIVGTYDTTTHKLAFYIKSMTGYGFELTSCVTNGAISYTKITDNTGYTIETPDYIAKYNDVTVDTVQEITAKKTFVGQQLIDLKQNQSSDQLGFNLLDSNGKQYGSLQAKSRTMKPVNGSSMTYDLVSLVNYTDDATNHSTTQLGFRCVSQDTSSSKAFNFLVPKDTKANMNSVYGSSYDTVYFATAFTNGTNTAFADKKGLVDISSLISSCIQSGDITVTGIGGSHTEMTINMGSASGSPKLKIGYLSSTTKTMNFLTAFPTGCYVCIAYSLVNNSNYSDNDKGYVIGWSSSGFTVSSTPNTTNGRQIYYIAIGY